MQFKTKEKLYWIKRWNKCKTNRERLDVRDDFYRKHAHRYKAREPKDKKKNAGYAIKSWVKKYNSNMTLISQTGKKATGRPKSRTEKDIKDIWEKLPNNVKYDIFKEYIKEQDKKKKSERMKNSKKFNWTFLQKSLVFNLSVSGLKKNYKNAKKDKTTDLHNKIINVVTKNSKTIQGKTIYLLGRRKVCKELMDIGIKASNRHVGRIMAKYNISCSFRVKTKKEKEVKVMEQSTENVANRMFSNPNIVSADTTYIDKESSRSNNTYLEAMIHWSSNFIPAFNYSISNDKKHAMKVLQNSKPISGMVVHTDRGSNYYSLEWSKYLTDNNLTKSLSRKGNSLDNRPIEYFFGCLKSECLNHYNLSKLSLKEVKKIIQEYIYYYNYERKQENLGWKTPAQALMQSNPKYSSLLFMS